MLFVVLGMHKSGTTLVSQMLHRSGIHMGEFDESISYDQGNWFERAEFLALNRRILAPYLVPTLGARLERWSSGGAADPLGANRDSVAVLDSLPTEVPPQVHEEMQEIVEKCQATYDDWGFKDPRTCITYPLWAPILPPHKIVAVFRASSDFVRRNRKGRNAINPGRWWRALRTWTDYNASMATVLETTDRPTLVLRYDELMSDAGVMERLEAFVGRPVADARRADLHRIRDEQEGWIERIMARTTRHDPRAVWSRLERLAEASRCDHRA